MVEHFKKWNRWRKNSRDNKIAKFLVLIGLSNPPTFKYFERQDAWAKDLLNIYSEALITGEIPVCHEVSDILRAWPQNGVPVTTKDVKDGLVVTVHLPE